MGRTEFNRAAGAVAVAVAVTLVAGCGATGGSHDKSNSAPSNDNAQGSVLPDSQIGAAVENLPSVSTGKTPVMRLAPGLAPPTNRWFSGLVFGEKPQPVFPLPLSFALTDRGFTFGLPAVTTTPNTITAGNTPSIMVDAGSHSQQITAYDDASVTIQQRDASGAIGSTVVAEGSPLVSFTAAKTAELTLGQPFTSAGVGLWSVKIGETAYGLKTSGKVSDHGSKLTLAKGGTAVWFPVPKDGTLKKVAAHASALNSVSLEYSTDQKKVTTTLGYRASDQKDTLFATMPHQQKTLASSACDLGSYPSAYGTMTLCAGSTLSWTAPVVTRSDALDLKTLSAVEKAELKSRLAEDVANTTALPADTYFGGKALYRLANLMTLADQIGDTKSEATLSTELNSALRKWTSVKGCAGSAERCFGYNAKLKGLVGQVASFGSEEFNDHNFHYGYFLYAASVAAAHDPELRADIAPVINLLAADLATSSPSKYFPERRGFDAYTGHSWASGFSPFADGNNLESSSEAVSAWNGLALWGGVTKNIPLADEATWMLSSEAASGKAYWTDFDSGDATYRGYSHSVVSLNWGGKRDYATWFSAESNAKLGIQLIPMSPASSYLGGDPSRIEKNLSEAAPSGYDVQFGDYLLMYSALAGSEQAKSALATARTLPQKFIDDGNSRSYLLAWIMTRPRS